MSGRDPTLREHFEALRVGPFDDFGTAVTRLQAAWYHAGRRTQRPRRHGHRPQHAAPSSLGVHSISEHHRGRGSGRQIVHVILDNCTAHEHPNVRAWLDRQPRFVFHFTPTSCSLLNAVEAFRQAQPASIEARCFPLPRRSPGRNQPLGGRNQRRPEAPRMDGQSRQNHHRHQARAPNVRFYPLGSRAASRLSLLREMDLEDCGLTRMSLRPSPEFEAE
jgi:hypothetical protein